MFVGHNSNRVIPPDNSLTMASAMAHGFEKLFAKGKFGSMRKPKSQPRANHFAFPDPPVPSSAQQILTDEPSLFPPPSFIRPKTSRMFARDEASPSCRRWNDSLEPQRLGGTIIHSSRRQSVSDSQSSAASSIRSSYRSSVRSSVRSSTSSTTPQIPRRSSSLVVQNRAENPSLASLVHYEFSESESKNAERSLSSLCAPNRSSDPHPTSGTNLDGTPTIGNSLTKASSQQIPPTNPDESDPPSPLSLTPKATLASPRQSFDLDLVPDQLSTAGTEGRGRTFKLVAHTRRPSSPILAAPVSPVLQEPRLSEFLSLSDDDIAESRPPTPDLVPAAESASEASSIVDASVRPKTPPKSPHRSLRKLDLSPTTPPPAVLPPTPLSIRRISARLTMGSNEDRAAAMAAFEVARIASRYGFDLIYVIDMWPRQMIQPKVPLNFAQEAFGPLLGSQSAAPGSARLSTQSTSSGVSRAPGSYDAAHQQMAVGLDYRFLAAYGLHTVKPPLNIAHGVHSKILKTEGWIEYRQAEPSDNEFARGYACSLYTGYAPVNEENDRRSSLDSYTGSDLDAAVAPLNVRRNLSQAGKGKMAEQPHKSEHNRGIVFAAYRKRQQDGLAPALQRSELKDLQLDAEALVDMIVDFHKIKRRSEQLQRREVSSRPGAAPMRGSVDGDQARTSF